MAITTFPIATVAATASNVVNVPSGTVSANNVQIAINQLAGMIPTTAGQIINVPLAPVTATNVQAAINQLGGLASSAAPYNVKNYGAVGNGVADDSTAIHNAVNAAYAAGGAVYFPAGIYLITQDAVLTQTVESGGHGLLYYSDGAGASTLRLSSSGSPIYFYNNGATPRMLNNYFRDLGFEGMDPDDFVTFADIPDNSRGFRLWATTATGSREQNFHFTCCSFRYLNNAFETAGDNTASENSWVQCEFGQIKNSILSINNLQSFNHEFHACDFTVIYGNAFSVAAGGGAIKMYGGSVILDSAKGTDIYFFSGTTAAASLGGNPNLFDGVRFEFRGQNTKLVSTSGTQQFDMTFSKCLFEDFVSGSKSSWIGLGSYGSILFHGCLFYEIGGGQIMFDVGAGATGQLGENATVTFDACGIPIDWSDRCNCVGRTGGIIATGCYGMNVGVSSGAHWAHDFDMRWDSNPGQVATWPGSTAAHGGFQGGGSASHFTLRLKFAEMIIPIETWPALTEMTLKLPRNAIIKNIHLRKPSGSADATVTTFSVGRNDKSGTAHLVSNSAAFNLTHNGDTTNYFYHVGDTTNERQLRLYASAATTGSVIGGFCVVEYY